MADSTEDKPEVVDLSTLTMSMDRTEDGTVVLVLTAPDGRKDACAWVERVEIAAMIVGYWNARKDARDAGT